MKIPNYVALTFFIILMNLNTGFIHTLQTMPLQVIFTKITPPGTESTVSGLFQGLKYLGTFVFGPVLGGYLAYVFRLSKVNYDSFYKLYVV